MSEQTKGAMSLATLATAVRLASDREALVMAGLSAEARSPRLAYVGALTSAAHLIEELAKAAAEGDRRTRGPKGRLALWLGRLASRLIR